ncbi:MULTISPECIES: heavy metal translocating P-type ATPase [Bacillaceae]|uniref:Cadmium-translocating P-type ATPase n=1 Tax=Evansella alkalicola TaxID=745819 RepID=A0ABS6K0R6_9BACI|nr:MULTISPECIES: heavy metal translocating P-type ATPase [Bacillaceae]MBU9724323.1 cadmium-translocating P-type ATPase [Bacillus alkalicola]
MGLPKPRTQEAQQPSSNKQAKAKTNQSTFIKCCHVAATGASKHRELLFALLGGIFLLAGYIAEQTALAGSSAITLYLLSYAIGGYYKTKEGVLDLVKDRSLNVEILMILAAIGAAYIGYWNEGAILIFIFSLSGAMETYTFQKSEKDLSALIEMAPAEANLIDEKTGNARTVPVDTIEVGDRVLIRPGERVPVDGVVINGETTVDEAALTGEAVPVTKTYDSQVFNGTINGKGSMTVEVTKKNADSLFQKMIQLVQQAKSERPPTQLWIEKIEGPYVITVLMMVALMIVIPYTFLNWGFEETFYRAMVLLVVASPCAVVASVMPALLSAISTGARNGVLMKGGMYLEQLSKANAIAFDKTGTITKGQPEVTDSILTDKRASDEIFAAVAAVEHQSNHPLAKAIFKFCQKETEKQLPEVLTIEDVTGYGVQAEIASDKWLLGSIAFMKRSNIVGYPSDWKAWERNRQEEGKTIVYAAVNDEVVGAFAIKDQIRKDAKETLRELQKAGVKTIMITGDHEATAASIAKEAGVDDWISESLPEQKVEEVVRLKKKYGSVIMVGDGVNDAPALAKADIGIAMGSGTDVAIDTADLVLMKSELDKIRLSLRLSKRMNRIVKQNLVFSMSVIVLLIIGNFFQQVSLPLGVIGHEGSTILVILNGLRLLKT